MASGFLAGELAHVEAAVAIDAVTAKLCWPAVILEMTRSLWCCRLVSYCLQRVVVSLPTNAMKAAQSSISTSRLLFLEPCYRGNPDTRTAITSLVSPARLVRNSRACCPAVFGPRGRNFRPARFASNAVDDGLTPPWQLTQRGSWS